MNDSTLRCSTPNVSKDFSSLTGIKLPTKPINQVSRTKRFAEITQYGHRTRRGTNDRTLASYQNRVRFYISAFFMDGVETYKDFEKSHSQNAQLTGFFDPVVLLFDEPQGIRNFTPTNGATLNITVS